jgi:hypothetical protein
MSLPITAVGPLKVETKPILMVSPADAGCASARTVAPASQNAFFIFTPLLVIEPTAGFATAALVPRASYQVGYFVREIAAQRQARTNGPV